SDRDKAGARRAGSEKNRVKSRESGRMDRCSSGVRVSAAFSDPGGPMPRTKPVPAFSSTLPAPESHRVIADLNELRALTQTDRGAQRVAWGPVWRTAREWFAKKVKDDLGLEVRTDAAANAWVTLEGESKKSIIFGSHLDSVPNGGWLDGALGV